jgi:uracil-DNA glycosylase family 4
MIKSEQQRLEYLDAMGIQAWVPRQAADGITEDDLANKVKMEAAVSGIAMPDTPQPQVYANATDSASAMENIKTEMRGQYLTMPDWDELEARVRVCTACALHGGRTQTVFGVGNRDADWMVIGEAPGEQEDLQGEPFVGRAGQLLTEMLFAMGMARSQVYIANILKCRPPGNRDPQSEEVAACENYLKQQIALVKPRIILAVGRIAAQNLLKTTTPIGKLRGSVHRYADTPLVVTYHPAYLLRSPLEKRRAWDDLCLAAKIYQEQC